MRNFLREGAIHLVGGYDHLLFLLSLVLGAGLLAKSRGLGRALMTAALASLEGRGVTSTLLWATEESRTLYERHGFGPPHPDVMERMG